MRLLGWIVSTILFLGVAAAVAGVGAFAYFSRDLPDFDSLADYQPPVVTRLYASDGNLLAEYAVENRVFVPIGSIPPVVVQAFVSAEDKNFYTHPGIDIAGIARAVLTNLRSAGSGERPEGASTITQQIAKNFLLSSEVSYERKIREAILALRIERKFSKDQILELYLNQIYLGYGAYGVAAAGLSYFNRSLSELTLAQAAFLAGLPKAPNNYNPVRRHDAAVARRDYVLDRMLADGAITAEEAAAAKAEPLEVIDRSATQVVAADYFAEEVRRELQSIYGDDTLYQGGLYVRTTLEPRLQDIADRSLRAGLVTYDQRHGWRGPVSRLATLDDWAGQLAGIQTPPGAGDWRLAVVLQTGSGAEIGLGGGRRARIPADAMGWAGDRLRAGDVVLAEALNGAPDDATEFGLRQIPAVQGALVAMDPHTGRVLAISGGFSYEMSEFDRATQALRQPGSAFKPFVYLTALEHGYTPSTILMDSPLSIDLGAGAGTYSPENYGNDYLGPTPLRVGIEKSRNIMTVRLLQGVGLGPVRDTAKTFGVYDDMPLMLSMGLGAGETTPLRLTTAYAMLVNGGRRITPTFVDRVQDRTGRTIYRHDLRGCDDCQNVAWGGQPAPELPDAQEQVADPIAAYQMVSMLEGVVQRGTATRLKDLGIPLAGKTGTTNDSKDAWFVGFSPDLAVGVFVGFDEPKSLGARETGGVVATPIFGSFMTEALAGQEIPPFRIPSGASLVPINPATGELSAPGQTTIWEAYQPGTEPGSAISVSLPGNDGYGAYGTDAYGTYPAGTYPPGAYPPGSYPGGQPAPYVTDAYANGVYNGAYPSAPGVAPAPVVGGEAATMGTGGLY